MIIAIMLYYIDWIEDFIIYTIQNTKPNKPETEKTDK